MSNSGQSALTLRSADLAHTLVEWPSVTGSPDEAAYAQRLAALLTESPYFAAHPGDVRVAPIPDDPTGRASVLALVRGSGRRTVILTGHFDVVPVEEYGDLRHLAGEAERLRAGLIERLRRSGLNPLALVDLESGAFTPGRGMLDMKSGLAAGIAVQEAFAAQPERTGNVLFIAVPDEENRSDGMRAVAELLPAYLAEQGLDVALAINLDAVCDNGDGALGRIVAMGCVGKLLLSAYVVGKGSHACYPHDGVNGGYLAAELVAELECAADLGEVSGGELAAPPTLLGLRDLKPGYNVTTPDRVWAFWNVLTHRRPATEMLARAARHAEAAAARAARRMQERAAALGHPVTAHAAWSRIAVLPFADLLARAKAADAGFAARFTARADALAQAPDIDFPSRSRMLTDLAWDAAGLDGPAIVLGVASMPYPAIGWPADAGTLEACIDAAMATVSAEMSVDLSKQHFFPGIADMSFLGPVNIDDLRAVAAQTPLWGSSIRWNLDAPQAGIPTVNIGPWGRDYHHWLERTHSDYTFRVLPRLVQEVVRQVLG